MIKDKNRLLLVFDLKIIDLVNQLQTEGPFKPVVTINVTTKMLTKDFKNQGYLYSNAMPIWLYSYL